MINRNYDWPMDPIRDFCRRWKITEMSVFGCSRNYIRNAHIFNSLIPLDVAQVA